MHDAVQIFGDGVENAGLLEKLTAVRAILLEHRAHLGDATRFWERCRCAYSVQWRRARLRQTRLRRPVQGGAGYAAPPSSKPRKVAEKDGRTSIDFLLKADYAMIYSGSTARFTEIHCGCYNLE